MSLQGKARVVRVPDRAAQAIVDRGCAIVRRALPKANDRLVATK
jgi:hypothetical protein